MKRREFLKLAGAAAVGGFSISKASAQAETWPNKPVKLILPYAPGGATDLIVDLAEVPFIDSAGLATLVSALKLVRRVGGSVLLVGVQPQARTVFCLTMLDQVVTIHPTIEAALASLDS